MDVIDFQNRPIEGIFALVYGDSGTGKTHLMATLGELGYTLIVDVDKGTRTIQKAPELKKYWNNLEVVSFEKFKDLNELFDLTQKNDPVMWNKYVKPPTPFTKPFDWIVIDTWTEVQWLMMQKLRQEQGLGGGDAGVENLAFRKNIQIQHWGMMTDLNKLSIESFKSCKHVNIIFTMQESIVKDEITGQTVKGPAIHGKLVKEMPPYFEVVVHTFNDIQGVWCATTLPKQGWPAKTRLGVGKEYKNPIARDIFGG